MLSQSQNDKIAISQLFIAILSTIGSLLILLIYLKVKESRSYAFLLITYLSIANLISSLMDMTDSIATLTSDSSYATTLCYIEATIREYCQIFLIFLNTVICWILYLSSVYNADREQVEKKGRQLTILTLVVSAIFALVPFFGGAYGKAGSAWCWINSETKGAVWYVLCELYIPFWLTVIFTMICYVRIYLVFRNEPQNSYFIRLVQKLWLLPIVDIICYTAATVHRFYVLYTGNELFILALLQVLIGHGQGFLSALVVFWIKGAEPRTLLRDVICCRAKTDEEKLMVGSLRTASQVVSDYIRLHKESKQIDLSY